jgi:hypothetical protein
VSPVKYELGFISQKATFFIVTAVKASNSTCLSCYNRRFGGSFVFCLQGGNSHLAVNNAISSYQAGTALKLSWI